MNKKTTPDKMPVGLGKRCFAIMAAQMMGTAQTLSSWKMDSQVTGRRSIQ